MLRASDPPDRALHRDVHKKTQLPTVVLSLNMVSVSLSVLEKQMNLCFCFTLPFFCLAD